MKAGMFQVRYCTPFKTLDGQLIEHWHETRVFADDEVDENAELRVIGDRQIRAGLNQQTNPDHCDVLANYY